MPRDLGEPVLAEGAGPQHEAAAPTGGDINELHAHTCRVDAIHQGGDILRGQLWKLS
jgi:hypothetical protein